MPFITSSDEFQSSADHHAWSPSASGPPGSVGFQDSPGFPSFIKLAELVARVEEARHQGRFSSSLLLWEPARSYSNRGSISQIQFFEYSHMEAARTE